MRILSSAVILAVALTVGCSSRDDDNVQTPAAQAPAGGAQAGAGVQAGAQAGRAGGAAQATAGAQVTIAAHEQAMKAIAGANGELQKAAKASDWAAAGTAAQTLATQFEIVERFWTQRNKPDAVKLAQTGRQGAMDVVAATKAGDGAKAQMAAGNIGGTCKQCHGTYREADPAGGFRIAASAGITQ